MTEPKDVARARKVAVHECIDCAALPVKPEDPAKVEAGVEYRPRDPRPANNGGPRSRRCKTHELAHLRAAKSRGRASRAQRIYGISADEQAALWSFQGEACACGRKPKFRNPNTDHDHSCCPVGESCGQCVRGYLDHQCNREIVGRLEHLYAGMPSPSLAAAMALLRLASHLVDPPLARLRRGESEPYAAPHELAALITAAAYRHAPVREMSA